MTGNAITGTLLPQTDGTKALVHDWGEGYFLALKFSGFSEGLTYADVQVGLDPSEGAGMVTLDEDCNGVFKITDKNTQTLKVVQSDGTHTLTQTFDLSGLTLAAPAQNVITPDTITFDLNPDGANHSDKTFVVTPATSGVSISKFYGQEGAEPDPTKDYDIPHEVEGNALWSVDSSGLTATVYSLAMAGNKVGTAHAYFVLTDDSIVGVTMIVEDTT